MHHAMSAGRLYRRIEGRAMSRMWRKKKPYAMKKYIVVGGMVRSRNDGEDHFVSAPRLCELYQVKREECYFVSEGDLRFLRDELLEGMTILRPREDGKYIAPLSWTCHVCGRERPDQFISVFQKSIILFGDTPATQNVRFCNDRAECAKTAPKINLVKGKAKKP
jgi:hypothetical protein